MSFRKRSIPLSRTKGIQEKEASNTSEASSSTTLPGTRPSPHTSNITTSTGTASLDGLLSLGAGLALGTSLMIEEDGTTDYASSLLRCFAAEGIMQGHKVFIGAMEGWASTLPGSAEERGSKSEMTKSKEETIERPVTSGERMKIAWRYERLGVVGLDVGGSGRAQGSKPMDESSPIFCHTFDLTTRLVPPPSSKPITCIPPKPSSPFPSLAPVIKFLSSNPNFPVRLVLPSLLSPLFYPPTCSSSPSLVITYLHSLRAILRAYPSLTIMLSWPLALYQSNNPLTRWAERLIDGVITLQPFPHHFSTDGNNSNNSSSSSNTVEQGASPATAKAGGEEVALQGLIRVSKLPVLSERGCGVGNAAEDMGFALGRRRFVIRPFSLPPLDAQQEQPQQSSGQSNVPAAKDLEF